MDMISVKNNADAIIFHTAICAENVTNLPWCDNRNCIRKFLLRDSSNEKAFSEWRLEWKDMNLCAHAILEWSLY